MKNPRVMDRRHIVFCLATLLSITFLATCPLLAQPDSYTSYLRLQDTILFDEFNDFSNQWLLGIEEGSWTETLEDGKLFFHLYPLEEFRPSV